VPINKIWRWAESTPRSRRWCSHMAGIYSDCSARKINNQQATCQFGSRCRQTAWWQRRRRPTHTRHGTQRGKDRSISAELCRHHTNAHTLGRCDGRQCVVTAAEPGVDGSRKCKLLRIWPEASISTWTFNPDPTNFEVCWVKPINGPHWTQQSCQGEKLVKSPAAGIAQPKTISLNSSAAEARPQTTYSSIQTP